MNMIEKFPKVEIHIHAEATVQFATYYELNKKYKINKNYKDEQSFRQLLQISSLEDMIRNFFFLQSFFRAPEDFSLLAKDVVAYARRNNIWYMETYLSPSMVIRQGFVDFHDFVDPIVEVFSEEFKRSGIDIRIIIDVSRTFGYENAAQNLRLLKTYLSKKSTDRIIGIGLGGQELDHPCKEYEGVFKEAREAGFHRVVHAGEEVGPESIWEAITYCDAERIGHGTSAIYDKKLLQYLKEHQLPLEICPTSNIVTRKFVSSYEDHPIYSFYPMGLMVTLNTDDPTLFDVELNDEYRRFLSYNGVQLSDGLRILKNTVLSSFAPQETKERLLKEIEMCVVPKGEVR
ncbi:MAG TPA: adenosine deaminase [Termitinemataceae bacterium]|nr:adenosine deaminase [Termitinemataceae bacterium]HOM24169.1 adenosine deaminase [Termitinemataceae bacterium]